MPLLDWLNKPESLKTAGRVPYRLLVRSIKDQVRQYRNRAADQGFQQWLFEECKEYFQQPEVSRVG